VGTPLALTNWFNEPTFQTSPKEEVFARNLQGALIHYYSGQAENLTNRAGIGPAYAIESDPVVFSRQQWGRVPELEIFARGAQGALIRYFWDPTHSWRAENLTSRSGIGSAYAVAGKPVAIEFASNPATKHIYARNASGDLIHYYWDPTNSWRAENLTTLAGIGSAYAISRDPVAVNFYQTGNSISQHVFATSSKRTLIHYYWDPTIGWRADNLTMRPGIGAVFSIVGKPVVDSNGFGKPSTMDVFARNVNGALTHYYWTSTDSWHAENLTSRTNIGTAYAIASDVVIKTMSDSNQARQDVLGRNSQGALIDYYWTPTGSWGADNMTNHPNIGPAYSINSDLAIDDADLVLHVFARNSRGELVRYYRTPTSSWQAENVTLQP
jgi:hypothetical protein